MPIHDALSRLILSFEEERLSSGEVRATGSIRLGSALEGPPGRLHGGHHAFVRTLPILERLSAHDDNVTFPCTADVTVERGLNLEEPIPFNARYRSSDTSWEFHTRFDETDRLDAHVRSRSDEPLLGHEELERWRELYAGSTPAENSFAIFGVPLHYSSNALWLESHDPLRTLPDSLHAALVEPGNKLGAAFVSIQIDTAGASARGTMMRHPHFTKRIEIDFATGAIPAETHLICIADRTRIEEDPSSDSAPIEIKGEVCQTVRIPVVLADASFTQAFATGTVTAHPVDPDKFEALKKMRELREDV